MDKPAPAELLAAVDRELTALEAALADAERAGRTGDWEAANRSFLEQRRLQHALENAMHAAREARTPAIDEVLFARLSRIGLTRDRQIAELQRYRDGVSEQLNTLGNWKRAARKWLSGFAPKAQSSFDQHR